MKAAMIVDYQKWFGDKNINELYVEWGEKLAPIINNIMNGVKSKWWIIVASKDWHPEWNIAFASSFIWKSAITSIGPIPEAFVTIEEIADWTETNNWLSNNAKFTVAQLRVYLETNIVDWKRVPLIMWPDHQYH